MRILIADDHEIIRSSVIRVLQSRADVECAEATNGKEAVEKALEWKPDLILLDVRLPMLSGFDAAREIKRHQPDIPILKTFRRMPIDTLGRSIVTGLLRPISVDAGNGA